MSTNAAPSVPAISPRAEYGAQSKLSGEDLPKDIRAFQVLFPAALAAVNEVDRVLWHYRRGLQGILPGRDAVLESYAKLKKWAEVLRLPRVVGFFEEAAASRGGAVFSVGELDFLSVHAAVAEMVEEVLEACIVRPDKLRLVEPFLRLLFGDDTMDLVAAMSCHPPFPRRVKPVDDPVLLAKFAQWDAGDLAPPAWPHGSEARWPDCWDDDKMPRESWRAMSEAVDAWWSIWPAGEDAADRTDESRIAAADPFPVLCKLAGEQVRNAIWFRLGDVEVKLAAELGQVARLRKQASMPAVDAESRTVDPGRDPVQFGPADHKLTLNVPSEMPPANLASQLNRAGRKIVRAVRAAEGGKLLTGKQLAAKTGYAYGYVRKQLAPLVDRGFLVRVSGGYRRGPQSGPDGD
jgi:hypothetical protein